MDLLKVNNIMGNSNKCKCSTLIHKPLFNNNIIKDNSSNSTLLTFKITVKNMALTTHSKIKTTTPISKMVLSML